MASSSYTGATLKLPSREFLDFPGIWVKSLDWDPEGVRIASAKLDGATDYLSVVDFSSKGVLWETGPGSWQVAWAPDGKVLAAMQFSGHLALHRGDDGAVLHMIEAPSGNQRTERPTRQFRFSPDGRTLAWGQRSGNIAFYDPENGTLQRELQGHTARVTGVDWNQDGTTIASASEDHTASVWDVPSGGIHATLIGHSAAVIDERWSPDESRLATAPLDGTVRLWDPDSGNEVARYPCTSAMRSVDWSPDGTRFIAGGEDGILVLDARPGFRADALERFRHLTKNGE